MVFRGACKGEVCVEGIELGDVSGADDHRLLDRQAALEVSPLAVDASDSEVARQLNAGSILDAGEEMRLAST